MTGRPQPRGAGPAVLLLSGLIWTQASAQEAEPDPASDDPVTRGAYVLQAAGCASCHTEEGEDATPLAGGVTLETAFGTFYAPNITPDPRHGIGGWTAADLDRALRQGMAPEGHAYFPAFPYTSYTGMTDQDVADLWAYLQTVPPSEQPNRPHELDPPFGWRFLLPAWRWLNFDEGFDRTDPGQTERWNRGAYLVGTLGHCGECHTPRGPLGGLERDMHLAGNEEASEGEGAIPNITPDLETGIGDWSAEDLAFFLEIGMLPDGDFAGGDMSAVIEETTSRLTPDDRAAIVDYLRSIPPIDHAVGG